MRGSDVDHSTPLLRLHLRQCQSHRVKRGGEIDRDDGVPLVDGKFVDRCYELDTGVVDQDIDRSELSERLGDHRFDLSLL